MKRNLRRAWFTLLPGLLALVGCQERDDLKLMQPDDITTNEVAMSIGITDPAARAGGAIGLALYNDAPIQSLGAVQGWLRFNPALLEYTGQIGNSETMVVVNDSKAAQGELRLLAVAPRGLAAQFAQLAFKVKSTGYAGALRWETEHGTWTKDIDASLRARTLSELRTTQGFSTAEARRMTEADWGKLGYRIDGQEAGGVPVALAPLERAPILYGDANQSGPAGANLLNSSDVLKAARISVGIEECVLSTSTPGATLADCVAANVAPENLPGLGEVSDAVPPGLDAAGGSYSRTINSSDVLAIARQSVGITQAVAGQQIPVSVLCGTFGGLTQNLRTQTCAAAPSDTVLMVPLGSGQDTVVTGTMTLTGDKLWIVNRVVRFGDDGTQGGLPGGTGVPTAATLIVQPGARVEGTATSAIVITRAATIQAVGTPVKPIVFTCVTPAGGRVPGCWGGVYLAGNAVMNEDAAVPGNAPDLTSIARNNGGGATVKERFAEGFIPANLYIGGDKDSDSCGTIKYAIFAYGGRAVNPANELNNLTIGACGSGTVLDFIQVHAGTDDGLEVFGGRMNVSHLYATANDDDNFDFSYGYDGNDQFILVQQEAGDKGHEVDNTETASNYNATPRTNARIWNFTAVGGAAQGTHHPTALHYRRGAATIANNGLVLSYNNGLRVDEIDACNMLPITGGTDVGAAGVTDDDLQFKWVLFIDVTATMDPASCSDASGHAATLYRDQQIAAGLAGAGWESRASMTAFPNRELRAPYDKFLPDFRPDVAIPGGTPPAGFDGTATYLGAFKAAGSGGNIPWSAGWTIGWQGAGTR